jgi:hypothetical protein
MAKLEQTLRVMRVFARMHEHYSLEQDPDARQGWTGLGLEVPELEERPRFWCCMQEKSFPAHINGTVRTDFTVRNIPTNRLYFSAGSLSGSFSVIDDVLTKRVSREKLC